MQRAKYTATGSAVDSDELIPRLHTELRLERASVAYLPWRCQEHENRIQQQPLPPGEYHGGIAEPVRALLHVQSLRRSKSGHR
jgi:hypothetical protein